MLGINKGAFNGSQYIVCCVMSISNGRWFLATIRETWYGEVVEKLR